jgi:hypothetical protein
MLVTLKESPAWAELLCLRMGPSGELLWKREFLTSSPATIHAFFKTAF